MLYRAVGFKYTIILPRLIKAIIAGEKCNIILILMILFRNNKLQLTKQFITFNIFL